MHRPNILRLLCFVAGFVPAAIIAGPSPLHAATLNSLTLPGPITAGATCAESTIRMLVDWNATTDDSGGGDNIAWVTYDGAGTPIAYGWLGSLVPSTSTANVFAYDGSATLSDPPHVVDLTVAPIKVILYDVSGPLTGGNQANISQAEAAPVLGQATFDPRNDPNLSRICANLRFPTVSIPALSPAGLAALIGLLALGAVALLRRRV